MFKTELDTNRKLRSELRKAENREKVAQCKLDRLKERFDKLYDEMLRCQEALEIRDSEYRELYRQLEVAQLDQQRASDEALMWRTQLFERMEILEETNQQLDAAEHELEAAWERVGHATATHQTSHEELRKRDRERLAFQLKIEELQKAQKDSREQANDLLGALTGAESAIQSLQRSNDLYQREVDGLKSLGASLTEKLGKATDSNDELREELYSTRDELELERSHSGQMKAELERLKDELYDAKGKLIAYKLEADVRQVRKTPSEKSVHYQEEKYGEFPSGESRVVELSERSLLSRASKRVTGWFRVSDNVSESDSSKSYLTIKTKRPRD